VSKTVFIADELQILGEAGRGPSMAKQPQTRLDKWTFTE